MSLPFAPGGGKPTRAPTHKPLDLSRLMNLGSSVQQLSTDGRVSAEAIEDRAHEDGIAIEHLYVAAAVVADIEIAREHDLAFEVCAGGCQGWGSVDVLEHLLSRRADRIEDSSPAFDVVPRRCLDKCAVAPAVVVVTPDGRAVLEAASRDSLDAAIAELLET